MSVNDSQKQSPEQVRAFRQAFELESAGQFSAAAEAYRQLLSRWPDQVVGHFNLGNVCYRLGDLSAAAAAYEKACEKDPRQAAFFFNLGNVRMQQGDLEAASVAYRQVNALQPGNIGALANLADAARQLHRYDEALDCLRKATRYQPRNVDLLRSLAHLLHRQQHYPEAAEAFERLLALDPQDVTAKHLLAALSGETPPACHLDHVRDTFDEMAANYDRHLQKVVQNQVPQQLQAVLKAHVAPSHRFSRVLDLGCGSGLSGQMLHPLSAELHGVDLSEKMVALARQKQIYDQLHVDDILAWLQNGDRQFDLVVAADVFVYFGSLAEIFSAVSRRCMPGGLFLFSTEHDSEKGYRLQPSGRYAHHPGYIKACAQAEGFAVLQQRHCSLRQEREQAIEGTVTLLKTGPAHL